MSFLRIILFTSVILLAFNFFTLGGWEADTLKLRKLYDEIKAEYSSDIVSAKKKNVELLKQTRSFGNEEWEVKAENLMGVLCFMTGNYDSAMVCYNHALILTKKLGLEELENKVIGNLGLLYSRKGDYDKAIELLYRSLEICEKLNDSSGMAKKNADIGNTYQYLKNNKKSLQYLRRALDIFSAIKDTAGQSNVMNSLGSIFHDQKDYVNALKYYKKSLEFKLKVNDKKGAVNTYINIANLCIDQNKPEEAIDYYLMALDISIKAEDNENLTIIYNDIGTIYEKTNRLKDAEASYLRALEIAKQISMLLMVKTSSMNLSQIYEKMGDYRKALEYNKLYYKTKIDLSDVEINEKIGEIEAKYETEKKDKEIILKDAEIIKQQADASKKAMQRNAFIAGFVLILIFTVFLIRLYLQKKRAYVILANKNAEIQQQKEEILTQRDEIAAQRDLAANQRDIIANQQTSIKDSIRYAFQIQSALFPTEEDMMIILKDFFIFYLPRDIVSGDFYWVSKSGSKIIVVAADCTGHGVPGAFMSMLGVAFLNEIVGKENVTNPAQILNRLRENIILAMKQHGENVKQQDGMDSVAITIDRQAMTLEFAGANNPLYIVTGCSSLVAGDVNQKPETRNPELMEIKGDKMPVSIYARMQPFTNHSFKINEGDLLYLFSDGFADQFGGPDGKKFKYKALKDLLLKNHDKTMAVQKDLLAQAFEEWKGENTQIDDVLIIGIKI